jgi:peptidylprolyl isomerase
MSVDSVEDKTLATGDGATVEAGDQVFTHIYIADGFTKKKAYSTYDSEQPQVLTLSDKTNPLFIDALEGTTVGSRVAVIAPADKVFGEAGNPEMGVGNKDSVLLLLDVMGTLLDGPDGSEAKAPAWAPKIVEKDGDVTGLDFAKAPKPNGKLREATLVKGTGATVEKGQTIYVNYLGQVYGAKKPFDESYSKDPASFGIGNGQVIPGWDKTLVGTKIGSRVLLAIPPKEGYGSKGNAGAGIGGTDTLYFVVDVLGAV